MLLLTGCQSYTTIVMEDGLRYRGNVESSDQEAIYLNMRGASARLERNAISKVSWRGQSTAILGGSAMGAGVVTMAVTTAVHIEVDGSDTLMAIGGGVAASLIALGLIPLILGVMASDEDKAKAELPDGRLPPHVDRRKPAAVSVQPPTPWVERTRISTQSSKRTTVVGAKMGLTF